MNSINYINGNAKIELYSDGTRVIEYENTLSLQYPLNIDIRVNTQCSFGQRPDGTYVLCNFCHESAKTDGKECDYSELQNKLIGLPEGIELAIGANNVTPSLIRFIKWCNSHGYIVNLTINQGHIKRDLQEIKFLIEYNLIKGLGVSYRSSLKWDVPELILNYSNTVFHVIVGIDDFHDVESLSKRGVKKILCLGEKDFGFNQGKVDLKTESHKQWFWWVSNMFNVFDVVSFDNLALEQLKIRRFFNDKSWEVFNQNEHSFFVDSVNGFYHPSSRSYDKVDWNTMSMKEYFQNFVNKR